MLPALDLVVDHPSLLDCSLLTQRSGADTRHYRDFRKAWFLFDPEATATISSHDLLSLIKSLPPPLGFKGEAPKKRTDLLRALGELNIPDHDGTVHFNEVLNAMAYKVSGAPVPKCDTTKRMAVQMISSMPKVQVSK